jgi:hypothetical protein
LDNTSIKKEMPTMSTDSVVKLNVTGMQGQEFFLVVDFATKLASVLIVEVTPPRAGNIMVMDVQPIGVRGA